VGGLWLKWPNDIWRGRKKLVGMLAELHTVGGRKILLWAAGINLNTEKFPADIKATSLKLIARRDFRVAALAQTVADESAAAFQAFASGRYEKDFWALWARYDKLTGRKIKFDRDGKTVEGRVMGLAADGSLCVKTAKGIETIRSGEVSLSRYL
jgi:BirA family biotin operon repressor/biotin-[acetyl-CoA-carboxylase] ligase